MRVLLAILLLNTGFLYVSFAQSLPSERLADWHKAGLESDFPVFTQEVNILDFDADPSGQEPCDDAFAGALSTIADSPVTIHFPKGKYLFHRSLDVPSNVMISGDGSEMTTFIFYSDDRETNIRFQGRKSGVLSNVVLSAPRGSDSLKVEDPSLFNPGDLVRISFDDTDLVTSSWALGTVAQIVRVKSTSGQHIYLDSRLRMDIHDSLNPVMEKLEPVANAGIKGIKIIQTTATDVMEGNIVVNYGNNIKIEEIESHYCNFSHVVISNSSHVQVGCSYFHNAYDFGGGGKGYGVTLQYSSSECLVENNVLDTLRHSVLLQAGVNGNVIAYNYSDHPYWTGTILPQDAAGDMVLHGNYPFCNLFESNICHNIVIDDSHGKNGPYNSFLRNRAVGYGIFMNFSPPSDSQNFISNVIQPLPGEQDKTMFFLQGTGHLLVGNYFKGNLHPSGAEPGEVTSLYKTDTPGFFLNHPFPAIGAPGNEDFTAIPAWQRYHDHSTPVGCEGDSLDLTSSVRVEENKFEIAIFPNPVTEEIAIKCTEDSFLSVKEYQIKDITGKIVKKGILPRSRGVTLTNLQPGIYFMTFLSNSEFLLTRSFIKL